MKLPPVSKQREIELILSVLYAYKEVPPVPWGITEAGWWRYVFHENAEVRHAARTHPYCPKHIKDSARKQASR